MIKLSICIPTYNRANLLRNCLHSIIQNKNLSSLAFEVCVSDNASTDHTAEVVDEAQSKLKINYFRVTENLGMSRNFLNVVNMASGEFVWMIGDDDLLMPDAVERTIALITKNPEVDFFYINSNHLTTEYVLSFPQPFDINLLPSKMKTFSKYRKSGKMDFFDLIDPDISFDFLGGIFLAVFRRENWIQNEHILNKEALEDSRTFSHFDNTFPHLKIYSKAFANSKAYFHSEPLSVCLQGAREWSPMYPLIKSVRFNEGLEAFKANGLRTWPYLKARNFALNNFVADFINLRIRAKNLGWAYINPYNLILQNVLFPNTYLSFFYFFTRRIKILINKALK